MPSERSGETRPSVPCSHLWDMLDHHAKRAPGAPAILAPGRAPLTYSRLYRHINEMGRALRAEGIGRADRVAVVLPSGPEMAVAFLVVAASAVCAPLNPAYRAEELERYFADLRPRALVTQAGIDSPARRVALALGVRVLELSTAFDEAGLFTLAGEGGVPSLEPAGPGTIALTLFTSGTTSRPKIVPLTHVNLCKSASMWVSTLALGETDRCLNVLPLYYGHGLLATVLASLAAGASIVCPSGFDVGRFTEWLTAFRPTWYSAVPTLHQAILAQVHRKGERVADSRLRFVRSGSAPLPPRLLTELERTFETPVIEYYGMTETAASPITCNPLPPRQRKAGSVGVPVGLEVAIRDEGGTLLSGRQAGQVVIRGASVMAGYDGAPLATEAAFVADWFMTGDSGFFDDDGYLFLSGRSKEMINRGGEKIAPREVDDALLDHPAVVEAVTFAVPHPTLGEDVAAAVVLRPDVRATAKDIRQFVSRRVADFKVPRQILVVSEIPKGPTGKVQRVGLVQKFRLEDGAAASGSFVAPRTPLEQMLAGLWAELLRVDEVGIHDDFFALGGDSLLATQVLTQVYDLLHFEVGVARFFEGPTIAELARRLETLSKAGASRPSSAIVRKPRDDRAPASIAQERLWRLHHALPGMPFFTILYPLRLLSSLDAAVLGRSIDEIARRHEILRTTFAIVDGRHEQVIAPHLTVPLAFDDLHGLARAKKEAAGRRLIEDELLRPFDLAKGPLFRARLVRWAEREHLLLITMHQMIGDGWSLRVLVEELVDLYDAFSARGASPLAPLPIQYGDFAYWQRHWQSHPEIAAQLAYWRQQLADPLPAMELATARPKRAIDGFRTVRRPFALSASLSEAARRFGQGEGGTLFMALVAALKTLLRRYLAQEDLRVATLVANRNRPGAERLIGPLDNTIILRTNLGGDPTPREVVRRVRATTLAAFANQDLPFEDLVAILERERALDPAALARVMILLQNANLRPVVRSGHSLAYEETHPSMMLPLVTLTTFDVILMLHEGADGLEGCCVYQPHLFSASAINRLLLDFQAVLERMMAEPNRPISEISARLDEKRSKRTIPV